MNHLKDLFHHCHYASGSRKDYMVPCSNGILLQDLDRLYLPISNTVAYRDAENSSRASGQDQVYMLDKRLWGNFKVPFLFNCCLDHQFRSATIDLQRLKLLILITGRTSIAYDKWEYKIDHWFIKSTQHSVALPSRPSTIVCRPGKQTSSGSHESLVQQVEYNIYAIQQTSITELIIRAHLYFVVSMWIFIAPRQMFQTKP